MHELDLLITRAFAETGKPDDHLVKQQDRAAAHLSAVTEGTENHKRAIREGRA